MNKIIKVLPVSYYTGTGKYYVDYEIEVPEENDYGASYFMTQFKSFYNKELAIAYMKELQSLQQKTS